LMLSEAKAIGCGAVSKLSSGIASTFTVTAGVAYCQRTGDRQALVRPLLSLVPVRSRTT
jgi:hypothetical protein